MYGNHKLLTKLIAVTAIATLIFMALSFALTPSEADPSQYDLHLADGEINHKVVSATPSSTVTFDIEISHPDETFAGTHEFEFEIFDDTYDGPTNGEPTSWSFAFLGSVSGIITVPAGSTHPFIVTVEVTFLGSVVGEQVHFTITGKEKFVNNNKEYQWNETHLLDCTDLDWEYLTVFSGENYNPYWEEICDFKWELSCIDPAIYEIKLWNVGSEVDNIFIRADWTVWLDVNENGIVDAGDIEHTINITVTFEYKTGGAYTPPDPITLGDPIYYVELYAYVLLNWNVPLGTYLIELTAESETSGDTYTDLLTAYTTELNPTITSPVVGYFYMPGTIITMAYTESTGANIVTVNYYYDSGEGKTLIVDADDTIEGIQWDTTDIPGPFCDYGFYSIDIWVEVYDDDCRFGSDHIVIMFCLDRNPEPCELIIVIEPGWNLISIGVELDDLDGDYTASVFADEINKQVGQDIIKYVVKWDRIDAMYGEFNEYVVDSAIGDNFPIELGGAYYIYSTSTYRATFTIVGDCPACEVFTLWECWNLVGYQSMEIRNVADWAAEMDEFAGAPIIQAIVKYDKGDDIGIEDDDYMAWYPGSPEEDEFNVMPGEAYWIFSATYIEGVPYPVPISA